MHRPSRRFSVASVKNARTPARRTRFIVQCVALRRCCIADHTPATAHRASGAASSTTVVTIYGSRMVRASAIEQLVTLSVLRADSSRCTHPAAYNNIQSAGVTRCNCSPGSVDIIPSVGTATMTAHRCSDGPQSKPNTRGSL